MGTDFKSCKYFFTITKNRSLKELAVTITFSRKIHKIGKPFAKEGVFIPTSSQLVI